jgi:hypothetical protein
MTHDWISVDYGHPDFTHYGFHLKPQPKIWCKTSDGKEYLDVYQGYLIFGRGFGYENVTHWKPQDDDEIKLLRVIHET